MWGNDDLCASLEAMIKAWRTAVFACFLLLAALGWQRVDPDRLADALEVTRSPTTAQQKAPKEGWARLFGAMSRVRADADTLL